MFNISVIIPTYNRAPVLARAIDSVLEQRYPASEIIVVDDGSNDQTQGLISHHYPSIKYLHQSNKGVSAARNIGIQHAKHDWVCLLDSDDSWESNKLEMQINALKNEPDYLLCHTNETWYRNGELLAQKKFRFGA